MTLYRDAEDFCNCTCGGPTFTVACEYYCADCGASCLSLYLPFAAEASE